MTKAPKIVITPAPVLRKKAENINEREFNNKTLLALVEKMRASLATRDDGVAIAAPQVGVSKRLFVVSERAIPLFPEGTAELVYVNPTIIKRSLDKKVVEEGCLSVPKIYGRVRRATRVTIKAMDEHGREFSVIGRGLLAQIFQHETDHLDGKLFIDSAKETWEFDPKILMSQNSSPRFAFFGTDQFSVGVLDALEAKGFKPAVIIAAPDRPAGRGMKITEPQTKIWGKERGILVAQPSILDEIFSNKLKAAGPWDCFAVASYGKIIPQHILDIPEKGSLNVHPSLLPKHRGATPIETAMLNDEKDTGVSVILMDSKMDHGPILGNAEFSFEEWPLRPEVESSLADVGGELLAKLLPKWVSGEIEATPQNESLASYTKKLKKTDGDLSSAKSEREKFLRIQSMNPWPGAFFIIEKNGKPLRVKVMAAKWDSKNNICVFERLIPEGRSEMDWDSFQNGFLKQDI